MYLESDRKIRKCPKTDKEIVLKYPNISLINTVVPKQYSVDRQASFTLAVCLFRVNGFVVIRCEDQGEYGINFMN